MQHLKEDVGSPCPVCKRTIEMHDYGDTEPFIFCSEFCEVATVDAVKKFLSAKPGDFCVFPCSECGAAIEDEWQPNERYGCLCTKCYPKVQFRERTALLVRARAALAQPHIMDTKLMAEIDEVLK